MAFLKKIGKIFMYTLLVLLLIYNFTIIIKSIVVPNKTPSFFGIKTYIIISGSMQPYLDIGDIVIVKNAKEEDLKIGDVISYREGKDVITHRIKEINIQNDEKLYVTRGDNNNTDDSNLVKYEMIEGKVVKKVNNIGKIQLFLLKKEVIIGVVIIYYLYVILKKK